MPTGGSGERARAKTIEQRLDQLADLAKEATQLAGKVRTNLDSVAKAAVAGNVGTASGQIQRISEAIAELAAKAETLADVERSLGLRGEHLNTSDFEQELESELAKKGVGVGKGPDPYWLAYPAWFTVRRSAKGSIEVILNGDKLESLRPSEVAAKVAEVVNEKFQAKKFADLLVAVRQLLRRAGADKSTLVLEDVYEVLSMEAGRATRRKDFTKADFYYSVHRLAEDLERSPTSIMEFPGANRSEHLFFTKDGESRKYLTVEFTGPGAR